MKANLNAYSISCENIFLSKILRKMFEISNFVSDGEEKKLIHPVHIFKLSSAIALKEPLLFVLPAFPAKSKNRKKTFSHLPDMGEVLALKRLNDFAESITEFYPPGVQIILCSDGRVFSDLVGLTESEVTEYQTGIKDIIKQFQWKHLHCFDLEDVYTSAMSFAQMRLSLEREFAKPLENLKNDIKENKDSLRLFNGIHRFIKEDYLVLKPELSKNKISELSKQISYQVIQRSNAWSSLIAHHFAKANRLSIHPNVSSSEKFPIKLLDADENWGTPWHRVLMRKDHKWQLMKYEDVQNEGGVLKRFQGQYVYFEERSL